MRKILLILLACLAPQLALANTGPGKPVTGGSRVLVLYTSDVPFSPDLFLLNSGLNALLTSSGAYPGVGFNFTVEALPVPSSFNAGMTWASGASAAGTLASRPLTASDYCMVFDLRFENRNIPNDGAPMAGNDYVKGDTLVQADADLYRSYLASGGGLFVLGENWYLADGSIGAGFTSRMETMHLFFNAVASAPMPANAFRVGPAAATVSAAGLDPYSLESDYNSLAGLTLGGTVYAGWVDGASLGSGRPFGYTEGDPNKVMAAAWSGAELQPGPSAGRLIYWGDYNTAQSWASGSNPNMTAWWQNMVDFLFSNTCCSATGALACGGPDLAEDPEHPVISCFAAGLDGWNVDPGATGWSAAYDPAQSASGVFGGSLRAASGGGIWSAASVARRDFALGALGSYDQVCFSVRNQTGATLSFEAWSQTWMDVIASPAGFTVPSGPGWQSVCLALSGNYTNATALVLRLTAPTDGSANGAGGLWFDDFRLRRVCGGLYERDPDCCINDTPTVSPTRSPTRTPTPSRTPSPSPSSSPTPSASPSPSASPTATPSPTATATSSQTATATPSATATVTPSQTPSRTVTGSPTLSDTPSATPSATFINSPLPSSTATPAYSPTGTATPTPSPSASPTATVTLTASPTATASPTRSPTASVTPTASLTPTFSASPSASASPTPGALLRGQAGVYNSAGERVAWLAQDLPLYAEPLGLQLLQASFVPDSGGSGLLRLSGPGILLAWDGRNSAGQWVGSGAYVVSVEWRDPWGRTSALQATLSVLRAPQGVEVAIFNSAGELVRSYSLPGEPGGRLQLSGPAFVSGDPAGLGIKVGSPPGLVWDGRDARGHAVAAGTYLVQVTSRQGAQVSVDSQAVQVLAAPGPGLPRAVPLPNPALLGTASVELRLGGPPALWRAQGSVYNVAGERVSELQEGPLGLHWQVPRDAAPGLYLAVIHMDDGAGRLQRQWVKLALLR